MLENRIQKYLVEMFQEERIKKVRKTTKWAVTMNDDLKDVLIDCENWAKLTRKGGMQSHLLGSRRGQDENIKIGDITSVSQLFHARSNLRLHGVGSQQNGHG